MEDLVYKVIIEYRTLKDSSRYMANEHWNIKLKGEGLTLFEKVNALQEEINRCNGQKELAERFRINCKSAVDELLRVVKKSRTGSSLDRNQGLTIENFVFGKVAGVLRYALKFPDGVYLPDFYFNTKSDFNEDPLRNLLLSLKGDLQKSFDSYLQLESCVEGYLSKIRELWKAENKNMISTT
jgi:hypothetical protein